MRRSRARSNERPVAATRNLMAIEDQNPVEPPYVGNNRYLAARH